MVVHVGHYGLTPTSAATPVELDNVVSELFDLGGSPAQGVLFQGCQITSTRGRSFVTITPDPTTPLTFKDTVITHSGSPQRANYVCGLTGTYLENVSFKESYPPNTTGTYRIGIHNSIIGPNVVVDGPVDRADPAPHVGTLLQGRVL